jgi:hypothetical protein
MRRDLCADWLCWDAVLVYAREGQEEEEVEEEEGGEEGRERTWRNE